MELYRESFLCTSSRYGVYVIFYYIIYYIAHHLDMEYIFIYIITYRWDIG